MGHRPEFEDLPESAEHQHKNTPKEALVCALGESELEDEYVDVIIIYNTRSGKSGSYDSGLTLNEANMLCDMYKFWLIAGAIGVIMGAKADALMKAVAGEQQEGEGHDDR